MSSKVYFPNLNGIRFIAALAVIIHHIEQTKSFFLYNHNWHSPHIRLIGKLGVVLFFVLSGFLITYLLLTEKSRGTISIRKFYFRRILRIWPLYYLIVILGLFVLPQMDFFYIADNHRTDNIQEYFIVKVILFFLFLPNLALAGFSPVPFIAQTWSVGVEEQFYLIWPVLIKKLKNVFFALISVILFYLSVKLIFNYINQHTEAVDSDKILRGIFQFWDEFSIDCMAIGGIAAYIFFYKKEKLLTFLFNKYFQLLIYIVIVLSIVFKINVMYLQLEYYSIGFAIIILNLAGNPASIIKLENRVFNYLGKISYGLYMFHYIMIVVAIKLLGYFYIKNDFFIYSVSIGFTIIISALSYEFFESKFLKMKKKYTLIPSGND
ncbi:MAG TPA: acyltransferase [Bacteroidia bacterium]|jgi:peptidoglycan/LPS O-acetylase OafA/YrhL